MVSPLITVEKSLQFNKYFKNCVISSKIKNLTSQVCEEGVRRGADMAQSAAAPDISNEIINIVSTYIGNSKSNAFEDITLNVLLSSSQRIIFREYLTKRQRVQTILPENSASK